MASLPFFTGSLFGKVLGITLLIGLVLAGLWLLALVYLWFWQESLLFHPEKPDGDYRFDLPATTEMFLDVPGAKLHTLYLRQDPKKCKGVVLFLHGNAGNLKTWFTHAEFWLDIGYDVFMTDYRGFGKSTGHIQSEAQLHADALQAWNYIAPRYKHKNRVIYGRSLGTGIAAHLAAQVPSDLLILVSAYESVTKIASQHYPWVPSALLRYPLDTAKVLPQVNTEILLLHGTDDKVISIEHSRALQKLNPRARLVEIPDAGHGDIHNVDLYINTLSSALVSLNR